MKKQTPLIDIHPNHWEIVCKILKKHVPQYEVWAFGSRATWNAKEFSDLDLAVITETPLPLSISANLSEAFSESDLPWKVDVVDWASTSESFREIIERDKVVVKVSQRSPEVANEWRKSNWGAEVILEYGKAIRGYNVTNGKYRVFGSNGPIGWTTDALTSGPGIILGRKGAYRGVEFCREPFWVIDTAYYIVPKTASDMRWLYYAVKHYKLGEVDDGSPIPSTTRSAVYMLEVEIPPLKEQRAIAHILGTLDDKIELNRKQSETLEAMARALFKAWFVDFEPVRAKLDGRWQRGQSLPGLPADHYDLFPDRLVESELGEIPEGWGVGSLSEVATHPRRSISPNAIKKETPYIALEHIPRRSIALSDWGESDNLESNKYEFVRGEILFGKLRPYFHKVVVAPEAGVCSTDIVVIAPKNSEWFGFILMHVSSAAFVEYTNLGSTGTKMPRTSWAEMSRYTLVMPCETVAAEFNQHIKIVNEEIIAKVHESRSIAQLRDTLLPKLISGELRVSGDISGTHI